MSTTLEFPNRLAAIEGERGVQMLRRNPKIPVEMLNTFAVAEWITDVDCFRVAEKTKLASGQFELVADDHREMLALLILKGEALLKAIKKGGIVKDDNFNNESAKATLDLLYETQRHEHGPKLHASLKSAIQQAFCGA